MRRPLLALLAWVLLLVGVGTAAVVLHPSFNDSFALPGQQSTTAETLLERLGGDAPTDATATVVWAPSTGKAAAPAVLDRVQPVLREIAALPYVTCVVGPDGAGLGRSCPAAAPTSYRQALDTAVAEAVAKQVHLPVADLAPALRVLDAVAPLEEADPAQLAQVAAALPEIARLAQAPRELLDRLAALTPAQLDGLVGLTSADIAGALDAVGGLDRFVHLPPAVLTAFADADPAALAAVAAALPRDVKALEEFWAAVKKAVAADPALGPALVKLAEQLGVTPAQLREAVTLIEDVAPLQDADPATLSAVARALPALAKAAAQARPVLDQLAALTPDDLAFLVGLTKADIDAIIAAFGGLDRFAQLPAATLRELGDADPARLAALAAALPREVGEIEKVLAEARAVLGRLGAAADAVQAATSPVSADGTVATATIRFGVTTVSGAQADAVVAAVARAQGDGWAIGATGAPIDAAGTGGPDNSVGIGLLVAFIVLLLAFGSLVAAGLPLVVALTGLAGGLSLAMVAARFLDVASFAPTLAGMIGLGVGLDYALFVLSRFTQEMRAGAEPKAAARTAVGTAGRAVLFAGCTVIVALLGMFVLGISFFNGLAVASALTVVMVMASALWFMPALLSLLGRRSLALRLPWRRHPRAVAPDDSRWARYGALLQKAPAVPALLALVVVGVLAWPALGLRQGFADDSSAAPGSVARVGYDLMARGFGPGSNGPFFVAVTVPDGDGAAARSRVLGTVVAALEKTPGVASTMPSSAMLPLVDLVPTVVKDGVTAVIVHPSTGPQDPATEALLDRLRGATSSSLAGTGAAIYVGGATAVNADFTAVLEHALPLFLLIVVGLGVLALLLLFRSVVVPLTAAVTSLLSFAAALGVTVAVFQDGVGDAVLGVTGTGPVLPFLPIMVFAILFGLSMDYQVFLVSRMREEWERSHDAALAVRRGLAGSGRVVVVAATIMASVFLSFVPTPLDAIKMFGVSLAAAVLVDAFVVRLVLVPSVMSLLGRANWWLPGWLDRVVPHVSLEGGPAAGAAPSGGTASADPGGAAAADDQAMGPGASLVSTAAPPTASTR